MDDEKVIAVMLAVMVLVVALPAFAVVLINQWVGAGMLLGDSIFAAYLIYKNRDV